MLTRSLSGFLADSMKKLQDQKHDMEREIKILHRKLRVSEGRGSCACSHLRTRLSQIGIV